MTVLSASGLSVERSGGGRLISEVSLSITPGEMVLLAGPSGSGKTLLGKALGGLLDSRPGLEVSGSVTRNGHIGFLFQNPRAQLVRREVRQDIAFGLENLGTDPSDIDATIREWASRLDATEFLTRDIEGLSRGETAVVALLGALVTEPDLLIFDEPLAPLDRRNRHLVLSVLDELRERETTMLVAEHDARGLLDRADRVLLLADGEISNRGTPRELAQDLREVGIRLPYGTAVALERGIEPTTLPLASEIEHA